MNTIRSVGYGWAVLCLAGGGSYYFAKRAVNADRAERALADEKRRQQRERMRVVEMASRDSRLGPGSGMAAGAGEKRRKGESGSNEEASLDRDAAAVEHALPKSRFEATEAYRSRKGDRFS